MTASWYNAGMRDPTTAAGWITLIVFFASVATVAGFMLGPCETRLRKLAAIGIIVVASIPFALLTARLVEKMTSP